MAIQDLRYLRYFTREFKIYLEGVVLELPLLVTVPIVPVSGMLTLYIALSWFCLLHVMSLLHGCVIAPCYVIRHPWVPVGTYPRGSECWLEGRKYPWVRIRVIRECTRVQPYDEEVCASSLCWTFFPIARKPMVEGLLHPTWVLHPSFWATGSVYAHHYYLCI